MSHWMHFVNLLELHNALIIIFQRTQMRRECEDAAVVCGSYSGSDDDWFKIMEHHNDAGCKGPENAFSQSSSNCE